jgi:NAD(P)-dependent dehydrogenase (short-subunit alcohol dehydrogenase family)
MAKEPRSLTGRVVAITGGGRGIGRAIAQALAREGARVAIGDLDRESAEQAAAALGDGALGLGVDVTDNAGLVGFLDEVEQRLGPLDVLVNNAGIADGGAALDTSTEAFDRVIDINLRGVWLMSTAAARRWRDEKRGGAIVNIASILGTRVAGNVAAYAVSKAGVIQMTEVHALEWARYGIRVNALAPGYFATDLNATFFESEPGLAMIRRIPMRRLGRMDDFDGAFLLLATDAARWMTGSTVTVDGGHLLSTL